MVTLNDAKKLVREIEYRTNNEIDTNAEIKILLSIHATLNCDFTFEELEFNNINCVASDDNYYQIGDYLFFDTDKCFKTEYKNAIYICDKPDTSGVFLMSFNKCNRLELTGDFYPNFDIENFDDVASLVNERSGTILKKSRDGKTYYEFFVDKSCYVKRNLSDLHNSFYDDNLRCDYYEFFEVKK